MFGSGNEEIARSLRSIERQLGALLNHLGVDANEQVDDEVLSLVRSGQKIAAIKRHRELTGAGLRDAKIYVESL